MFKKQHRTNAEIRVPKVRLILADGSQGGVVDTQKAILDAEAAGLDLVEVSPTADPPVCKIVDYGKFIYRQQKTQKKQGKNKTLDIKGVRLSLRISSHDLELKTKQSHKFLEKGHRVKVTLLLKGREVTHQAIAFEKINALIEGVKDVSTVDQPPKKMGYSITAALKPL